MFDFMMRRTSSTGSTSSLSLSPTGWNPSRPTISPPSVTASPTSSSDLLEPRPIASATRLVLSPEPVSRLSMSYSQQAYAFPSWPVRESLTPPTSEFSPTSGYFSPNFIPSSRISDDDLAALDFSRPAPKICVPTEEVLGISWSAVNNPSSHIIPAVQVCDYRRRLPPPPQQYRRRSSSRRSPTRKSTKCLNPIAE